jgi:hypothetical protein
VDHLFLHCSIVVCLWCWLSSHNNFTFNCNTIQDLWRIDANIPYKYSKICELIEGALLWIIWKERNRLIFQEGNCKSVTNLGASIIALARYWYLIKGENYQNVLHIILPTNINSLPVQIIDVTIGLELPKEEVWFENELDLISPSNDS